MWIYHAITTTNRKEQEISNTLNNGYEGVYLFHTCISAVELHHMRNKLRQLQHLEENTNWIDFLKNKDPQELVSLFKDESIAKVFCIQATEHFPNVFTQDGHFPDAFALVEECKGKAVFVVSAVDAEGYPFVNDVLKCNDKTGWNVQIFELDYRSHCILL